MSSIYVYIIYIILYNDRLIVQLEKDRGEKLWVMH